MKTWPVILSLALSCSACQTHRQRQRVTKEKPAQVTSIQPAAPKTKRPIQAPSPRFNQVISVDVVDTLLSEVIADICEKTGAEILVDPKVDRKISVTLRDLPWRDVVRVIARLYKLELKVKSKDKFVFFSRPKTNIEFADANLRTALLMLAKKSGQNIIIAPEVQGKVSARLKQVSAADALQAIAKNAGHEVVSSNSNTSAIQGDNP